MTYWSDAAFRWQRKILFILTGIIFAVTTIVVVQFSFSGTEPPASMSEGHAQYEVAIVDRNGVPRAIGSLPNSFNNPRVSPDGKRVVFDSEKNIWIDDLSNMSSPRRLTVEGNSSWPIWNGDGTRIIFTSNRDGGIRGLYSIPADGPGRPELLVKPARAPEFWPSSSATWFSYITVKDGDGTDFDIWTYSLTEKRSVPLVDTTPSAQLAGRFSPDLRWLAYQSNETDPAAVGGQLGTFQVYVEPFPRTGTRFQITTKGGNRPLWSTDGKELFYDDGKRLFSVAVRTQPKFTFSDPVALPISGFVQVALRRNYDLMPDGKRFLMMFRATP